MTELERMRKRFERAAEANVGKDAEIERLRGLLAEPWRHYPCPETQAPCDRMCLTMCHRRSEELSALRADLVWAVKQEAFHHESLGSLCFGPFTEETRIDCDGTPDSICRAVRSAREERTDGE